jgi:hypothetical protein
MIAEGDRTYTRRTDTSERVFRRRTEVVQDLVELVDIAARRVREMLYGKICYTHSRPLKMGFPARSSARMQPTDQTSIAEAYRGVYQLNGRQLFSCDSRSWQS